VSGSAESVDFQLEDKLIKIKRRSRGSDLRCQPEDEYDKHHGSKTKDEQYDFSQGYDTVAPSIALVAG